MGKPLYVLTLSITFNSLWIAGILRLVGLLPSIYKAFPMFCLFTFGWQASWLRLLASWAPPYKALTLPLQQMQAELKTNSSLLVLREGEGEKEYS